MQVIPGELTIITGVPNSGKSEWIDALLCNLAELHGWSFALCSMEKKVSAYIKSHPKVFRGTSKAALPIALQVTDHARQLLEKHFRQPFLNLDYGAGVQRMDMETVQEGLVWCLRTPCLCHCCVAFVGFGQDYTQCPDARMVAGSTTILST